MKLPMYLLVLFMVLVAVPLNARQSLAICYKILRDKGNQNFSEGKYTDAIKNWESAKRCLDKPASNDLQTLINNAKNKLDRDKDGVPDWKDSCPDRRGSTSNKGCPVFDPISNMVRVSGGTFTMGCTKEQQNCDDDENPYTVTLSDFYISKHEVTQKEWREVMGSNPSFVKNCDNCPVENISWDSIQVFLTRLKNKTGITYRLPTEAEWEYAARGGGLSKGYQYAGSNSLEEVAWHYDNATSNTHPVGEKKPNELGLYDMSGNVEEWCSDVYGLYPTTAQLNPKGASPNNGANNRVVRGGSCTDYAVYCRIADRRSYLPTHRNKYIGFRLARSL